MAYIIVKYADQIEGKLPREAAYGGYSCRLAGVEGLQVYATKEEAASDLEKLRGANESVDFGLVECD